MTRICVLSLIVTLASCRADVEPSASKPAAASAQASSGPEHVEPQPAEVEPAEPEPAPLEPAPPEPALPVDAKAPTMIDQTQIWRQSDNDQPPWNQIDIVSAMFGAPPSVGEAVTILPQDKALPTIELRITEVIKHDELADEGGQPWWEPVLAPVTDKAYFELPGSQFPGDVVVVYPATPSATLLDPTTLSADDLPPKILLAGVKVAVDVNADGRPDAIELSVCTEDPKRAECGEATGTEIYRSEGGVWSLVHRFEPAT
jgi:hypothetical protein